MYQVYVPHRHVSSQSNPSGVHAEQTMSFHRIGLSSHVIWKYALDVIMTMTGRSADRRRAQVSVLDLKAGITPLQSSTRERRERRERQVSIMGETREASCGTMPRPHYGRALVLS